MIINELKNNIDIEIIMNNEKLKKVKKTKYLGIIIDDKLNFEENFDHVCKKMA